MKIRTFCGFGVAMVLATAAHAQEASGTSPFPWFGSLKKTEVNVRSGPGNQYPILWVYQRAGYPVEVMARYDNYYKLRDVEGEEGWVYIGMVSRRVTALVGGKDTPSNISRSASIGSPIVARLAPGVVVELGECKDVENQTLCEVEAPGASGWIAKRNLEMVK
ncbi:MAG: hypothetical protein DI585_03355 [Pseudomonas fluorescens]|nr:MAG: hypothetical protein DI585_03355 [Pseudomonas fluorescens]